MSNISNKKNGKMKVAFVCRHPAPYRDEFIGRLVRERDLAVDVFSELAFDEGHAFWDLDEPPYHAEVIARQGVGKLYLCLRMARRLGFGRYDLVVYPGYQSIYLILPMLLNALLGVKYCLCADSVNQPRMNALKSVVKRFIVKRAKMIFVPGECGKRFFSTAFGVKPEKMCKGLYALNGGKLERRIEELRAKRDESRSALGIGKSSRVFLMVANMIQSRKYPLLVKAFSEVAKRRDDVSFLVVGRGPDLPLLLSFAKSHQEIKVISGCSFAEMFKYYALADVYVHGGTEPASTALVIGAIAGLPLISSRAVGCAADVLCDGVSGVRVGDYRDESLWSSAFERMLDNEPKWAFYGAAAREASRSLDLDVIYPRFLEMIHDEA